MQWEHAASKGALGSGPIELLRSYKFDIAFVDYRLPGENGADIIRSITPLLNGCVPILLTGDTSDLAQREALISGAQHCLLKEDVSPRTIETTIRSVIHRAYWR
ncbi:MAG: response regulator [Alphaproteobacteria bacterium]|nr:response regulator [Alphaproteobacteria bacterium]